jgi:ABC-type tungstate transport system substrate-binding protein
MRWYHYVAYFFWGTFLANACPISSMASRDMLFRAPSHRHQGKACPPATVNVLWGFINLAVGYLLLCRVGSFNLRKTQHVLSLGAGILIMSLVLAHAFARFHGGL